MVCQRSFAPLSADATVWFSVNKATNQTIAVLGLYADDILVITPGECADDIMNTIRQQCKTSEPEKVTEEKSMTIRKEGKRFLLHQQSYIKDMLAQWEIADPVGPRQRGEDKNNESVDALGVSLAFLGCGQASSSAADSPIPELASAQRILGLGAPQEGIRTPPRW